MCLDHPEPLVNATGDLSKNIGRVRITKGITVGDALSYDGSKSSESARKCCSMLFARVNVKRIFDEARVCRRVTGCTTCDSAKLNKSLRDYIRISFDIFCNIIKEKMQCMKRGTFHIPVCLFCLGSKIKTICKAYI